MKLAVVIITVTVVLLHIAQGQEPQEVHPWLTDCLEYDCFMNDYCTHETGICKPCPKDGEGTTEEDCRTALALLVDGNSTALDSLDGTTYYTNETAMQIDVQFCISYCVKAQEDEECDSEDNSCDEGRFFCDYQTQQVVEMEDDEVDIDNEEPTTTKVGTCKPCKENTRSCLVDADIASPFGVEECVLCDIGVCLPLHYSVTTEVHDNPDDNLIVPSNALEGSPSLSARGTLVSCSNLIYREELTCVSGGNDLPIETTRIDGMICLVEDDTKNSYFVSVVERCAQLGGVGVVFFQQDLSQQANNETWKGSLSYLPTTIPSASITYDDGKRWQADRLGQIVSLNNTDAGDACIKKQFCNDDIPCVGSSAGQYCDYKWGGGDGGDGFCRECPTDDEGNPWPLKCFFTVGDDPGRITGQKAVEACASTCASSLTFPKCKFCPTDVNGFDFGLENESDEKCHFCPENDVQYPFKEFPLFGENVTCQLVQKFFESVDVKSDSRNCQLAQMMNYVCGCAGPGYAGASNDTKKAVLAWLPRVMAVLSLLGSIFIVYDAAKAPEQRLKIMNQLLIALSVFDILGSCAYAFTTLPIPEDNTYGPIYGAKGNDASCTAQGFFIQMGTISAYMNVSLAVYYLLIIKYGWEERRVKKIRWALFLCPMLVGFAFAFAGIPYYDSLNLWCNNTASYWPDIPVAIAIVMATVIMATVCWDVYSKERASAKWQGGASAVKSNVATKGKSSGRTSLSERVFWQAFFYLMAFYLTWPAYLGLQYAWAGGSSFTNYGLILSAATMVPLQGFWNALVYIRPRYMAQMVVSIQKSVTRTTQTTGKLSWLSPSKRSKKSGDGSSDIKPFVNGRPPSNQPSSTQDKTHSSLNASATNVNEEAGAMNENEEEKQEE